MRAIAVAEKSSGDPLGLEKLSKAMPALDWHFVSCERELRAALEAAPADLILIDASSAASLIPAVLRAMRSARLHAPIVLLSPGSHADACAESGDGAHAFVADREDLAAVVGRALEGATAGAVEPVEERLAEQGRLLAQVADAVPDFLYAVDRDNRITVFNAAASVLLQDPARAALGRPIVSLDFKVIPAQGVAEENERVMSSGKAVVESERFQRGWDGVDNWVQVTKTPLRGADGATVCGLVTLVRNVTPQRLLERSVLDAAEREQRRLGSDLHDGLGQELVAAELLLTALGVTLGRRAPDLVPQIDEVIDVVRDAAANTRRIAQGLAPIDLEGTGLSTALERLAARSAASFGIEVRTEMKVPKSAGRNLSRDTHLYRIAQEAISNSVRHGKAAHIVISLRMAPGLTLQVSDDGAGFDTRMMPQDSSMGLRLMRYRATLIGATIVTESSPEGTHVTCSCPDERVFTARRANEGG